MKKKTFYKENKIKSKNVVREQLALLENYSTTSNSYPKSTVFIGDVLKVMKLLPDETVDCIITSPPYWKQRDYKHSNQIGQESSYEEYIRKLVEIFNEVKRVLKSHGTLFLNIGYKYQEKELLLIPELVSLELQKNGWTLINKIIWFKPNAMPSSFEKRLTNVYEPIFFFVKRNSKHKYYFNLDEIRIRNDNYLDNKNIEEYIGYTVENSINKNKKLIGTIKNIHKDKHGNYFAEVTWDDGNTTFEIINDFSNVSKLEPTLICPNCNFELKNEFEIENHSYCNEFISVILPEKPEITNLELIYTPNLFDINDQTKIRRYNGKFKINPDNRGASPGARKSLFGEYFVVQRRFKVYQNIIADYLRFWKDKIGITIKEIDKILGYKDTAGHWFRKDSGHWGKGGSIPSPEDWFKLKEILKFDNRYDRWLTETHLVLQTVKAHPKGKNPGDVWQIKLQPFNEAHFAVFPEELVKNCILTGCPEKGIVLDPFAGSGTTGKVAEELGRSSILIELVPDFLDIIKKRVKNIDRVIYVK